MLLICNCSFPFPLFCISVNTVHQNKDQCYYSSSLWDQDLGFGPWRARCISLLMHYDNVVSPLRCRATGSQHNHFITNFPGSVLLFLRGSEQPCFFLRQGNVSSCNLFFPCNKTPWSHLKLHSANSFICAINHFVINSKPSLASPPASPLAFSLTHS